LPLAPAVGIDESNVDPDFFRHSRLTMARRRLGPSTDRNRDSFNDYKPFILQPKDISWMGIIFVIAGRWGEYSPEFVYKTLQALIRETQNVRNR
jgi:hypothetical protein